MKKIEAHKHYWLADNHQHHKGDEVIFKLSYPRVFIRYRLDEAYFASFEDFFGNIVEVQWIDGEVPDKKTQEQIFIKLEQETQLSRRVVGRNATY